MKQAFLGLLLTLVVVTTASAQINNALTHALDSAFVACGGKNMSATLVNRNGLVWQHATGINSRATNDTLTTAHLMGIGSITKTYTATLLLLLQENNRLSLDDAIFNYLPHFDNVDSTITIRQLLNHTSGVFEFFDDPTSPFLDSVFSNPARIWTPTEVIQQFTGAPYFPRGTSYHYSNTNYLLAQLIIEHVTGNAYQTELRNKILTPLGLTHTYYYPFEIPTDEPIAHAWFDIDGDGLTDDLAVAGFPLDGFFSAVGGAGAILSNTKDVATFMNKLLNGKVLSKKSLKQMLDTVPQAGYGLGILSTPMACHSGWGHGGDLVYKSLSASYDNGNYTLAIQTSDDKNLSGINAAFEALLTTYCETLQTTAVKDLGEKIEFTLFPSPTNGVFTIKQKNSEGQATAIYIYDVAGRILTSAKTTGSETLLDVSGLDTGIYFVKLVNDGKTMTKKLSIVK